jgi:SAM-dependent methyltransferase
MLNELKHKLNLLTYSWRTIGGRRLVGNIVRFSLDPEARNVDTGFDAKFGTDTNAELTPAESQLPRERQVGATLYLPSHDQDLAAMLDALAWPAAQLADTTFVDVGSGKGRVVFLAAMRRFREVVGVELSPVLHDVALRNFALMRGKRSLVSPTRFVHGDAAELDVPAGPFIAYFFHPFREPVAELAMARILASLATWPRPAAILYGHPTMQRAMDPRVFAHAGVFERAVAGERCTRNFRLGWSVWTNEAWLATQGQLAVHAAGDQ